ncbi:5-oxoprolinase subunit C family protein [Metabacillus arenae]|uniref:Biotin-dependent carboxyltransferase family protein n=1 Tax=Metabacillus arenae TaxID=2771434 RepID=A0A926NLI9_9BACI|nr:biotin-dependent carboxyltransferase family protein [Metabacillus arenae]MBD1382178.1 biotin-dependent carboxyltransferase family protein [Metabacillus arenae]
MITIKKPGLLTSIQDLGRYGSQKIGVITSGVMDPISHRIANHLVGNKESDATIEMTMTGPSIEFNEDALISVCGGDLSPRINKVPVHMWKPVLVKKGSRLSFAGVKHGCRTYLAIAGGFDVEEVLNSKSTYLRAGIGGYKGRALKANDTINTGKLNPYSQKIKEQLMVRLLDQSVVEMDWSVSADLIPNPMSPSYVRVIKGRQFSLFSPDSQKSLFSERFEITNQSDRMGYRLKGPVLKFENSTEMISEAVSHGTIQVPAEGNPIILLSDRQTTGGYPKIGQIASVDIPLMAQLKPGEYVQFVEISHEESQRLIFEKEEKLEQLKQGILLKIKQGES